MIDPTALRDRVVQEVRVAAKSDNTQGTLSVQRNDRLSERLFIRLYRQCAKQAGLPMTSRTPHRFGAAVNVHRYREGAALNRLDRVLGTRGTEDRDLESVTQASKRKGPAPCQGRAPRLEVNTRPRVVES